MAEVLEHLSKIIGSASQSAANNYTRSMQSTQDSYEKLITSLNEYQNVIQENMKQLVPAQVVEEAPEEKEAPEES